MDHDKNRHRPKSEPADCKRRRLAEGGIAAVDVCSCGTLQVHLGALSIRMDEGALSEMVTTLRRALWEYALDRSGTRDAGAVSVFQPSEPGQA
jgi:hypothetical protein